MMIEPGTTTTLPPDQPAEADFVPVEGGFRLDLAIPRGPTGDIDGVTPFWVSRLGADGDAEAARLGLNAQIAGDYEPEQTPVTQAEAESGTETSVKSWSPLRVAQAIDALAPEVPSDVYRRANILDPVSQDGGTPTGGIIERGQNANGEYVRFADGTQICTNRWRSTPITQQEPSSVEWLFPATFAGNAGNISLSSMPVTPSPSSFHPITSEDPELTGTTFRIHRTNSAVSAHFWATAIGRWF